jgi:hypothetical protein
MKKHYCATCYFRFWDYFKFDVYPGICLFPFSALHCHAMQCIFMSIIAMLVNLGLYLHSAQMHFFLRNFTEALFQ